MARPFKPHVTSWGESINGLARGADKRWRVVTTGERFREDDERRAIAKFYAMTGSGNVTVPIGTYASVHAAIDAGAMELKPGAGVSFNIDKAGNVTKEQNMPDAAMWAWAREEIIARPENAAKMLGIPEIARLADLPSLQRVKLTDLIEAYEARNLSRAITKTRAVKLFKEFARVTGATLLNDLTQANIKEYRDFVEKTVDAPSTRKWQYGQVKSVLAFGLKDGIDAAQIRVALDKCKVLWVGEKMPAAKPCPMSPADFRALLAGTDDKWRAILLLGLNLCLHLGEVTALKWESFQGDYYSTAREKTGVARGAVLWQETKDAMAKLPRKGPYVLTSCHGTRFNRNGITNEFLKLRRQLGVAKDLTFEGVRDGAYTAALQSCEEKIVRVLAGHKSAGQLDSYVLRDPACTRPAVAAVHKVYGPFPS